MKKLRALNARRIKTKSIGASLSPGLVTRRHVCSWWDLHPGRMAQTAQVVNSQEMLRADFFSQRCTGPGSRVRLRRSQEAMVSSSKICISPRQVAVLRLIINRVQHELNNCQPYLEREIQIIQPKVIVCLGKIAFDRILKIFAIRNLKFSHGAVYQLPVSSFIFHPSSLLCSYHPSQQNTSTGKLTVDMFDQIWKKVKSLL